VRNFRLGWSLRPNQILRAAGGHAYLMAAPPILAILQRLIQDATLLVAGSRSRARAGDWSFTLGRAFIAAPQERAVGPFRLPALPALRALASKANTGDFNELESAGGTTASAQHSAAPLQYAGYGQVCSDTGSRRVARVVASGRPDDPWQSACSFTSLFAVSVKNADSRAYAGPHLRSATSVGLRPGERIDRLSAAERRLSRARATTRGYSL
jgi:hypothetical protein